MIDTKRLRELLAECDELDCDNWDCETARQMKHHLPALLDELERLRAWKSRAVETFKDQVAHVMEQDDWADTVMADDIRELLEGK